MSSADFLFSLLITLENRISLGHIKDCFGHSFAGFSVVFHYGTHFIAHTTIAFS
jgi:hypothetical protein